MTVHLDEGRDYLKRNLEHNFIEIQMTPDQAKLLRDQITKHLRGASRDKESEKG